MGHKVNPLVFRLGRANNWSYNLKEKKNWVTSYLIYQLVSNQFLRYTVPYFNREKTRNTRNDAGLVAMKGEKQLKSNSFLKRSILFSHVILGSRNNELVIGCYFYDYGINFRNSAKKFVRYNQLFSNVPLKRYKRHPYWRKQIKHRTFSRKFYRFLNKMTPNLWLFNLKITTWNKLSRGILKLNLIWLRLLSMSFYMNKTKKIFFFNVWYALLAGVLPILKAQGYKFLANRIYLVAQLINLLNFSQKMTSSFFFSKLFRQRYFLFKGVSKSITNNLKSMLSISKATIKFNAIREKQMTSSLLTNLIIIKLGQYFRINTIIYPLTAWIKRQKNCIGYRIIIAGRLTRRERASHMIKSGKKMPLSSYKHKIDYNQEVKIMKFGMVGIKVYLFLRKKIRSNYYYFKFVSNGS